MLIRKVKPSSVALGKAEQLVLDTAAVVLAVADILDTRTLLGVTGTFDLDALLVTLGFAAGKLSMTISSTTTVNPGFTAATLADADFLWIAPNGTHFTGKTPAGAKFVAGGVGTYRVYCTAWAAVTEFDANTDNVTAVAVAVATALTNLRLDNNQLVTPPDLTTNTALTILDISANQLVTPPDLTTNTALTLLYLNFNQLTSAGVNAVLAALVAGSVDGGDAYLDDQTPLAPPTGQGILDLATLVEVAPGRAWTITTD